MVVNSMQPQRNYFTAAYAAYPPGVGVQASATAQATAGIGSKAAGTSTASSYPAWREAAGVDAAPYPTITTTVPLFNNPSKQPHRLPTVQAYNPRETPHRAPTITTTAPLYDTSEPPHQLPTITTTVPAYNPSQPPYHLPEPTRTNDDTVTTNDIPNDQIRDDSDSGMHIPTSAEVGAYEYDVNDDDAYASADCYEHPDAAG